MTNKLENIFGDEVVFCRLEAKGKYVSQLIYSANTNLGRKGIMVEAALYLRNAILSTFSQSDELRWPPTVEYLDNAEDVIPNELNSFLKYVFFLGN